MNRFSYKNAIDGLLRVAKEEGMQGMFKGATMATIRAIVMTVGQLSVYDQVKELLLYSGYFTDNANLHFTSSITAVRVCFIKFN